jgi:hypothetical protein
MRLLLPILTIAALGFAPRSLSQASRQAGQTPPLAAPAAPDYVFPSGAGMLFFYVRPDKAADFESVVARLDEALTATSDPIRQQQAASWRVYRSLETHAERIYVFTFDPAVRDVSYDPVRLLSDLAPLEANELYAKLKGAIVRVERMGLTRVRG